MFVPWKISLFTNAILAKLRCISEFTGTCWLLNILCLHLKATNYCCCNMLDQQLLRLIQFRMLQVDFRYEKSPVFNVIHTDSCKIIQLTLNFPFLSAYRQKLDLPFCMMKRPVIPMTSV